MSEEPQVRFLAGLMLTLLQYLGVLILLAISLAGFALAVMGTFAIWFNRHS